MREPIQPFMSFIMRPMPPPVPIPRPRPAAHPATGRRARGTAARAQRRVDELVAGFEAAVLQHTHELALVYFKGCIFHSVDAAIGDA